MRLQGNTTRDGQFWLAEVPILEAATQGRTRKEAFEMTKDLIESLVNAPGFSVTVYPGPSNTFEVASDDSGYLVKLVLKRQREQSGLSLAEVANRLGVKSRNAYARYEHGDSNPTLEKLDQLLRAVSSGRELVIGTADL